MESLAKERAVLPVELKDRLSAFDESITQLEMSMLPLISVPRSELSEKLSPLDQAKVDLLSVYALNSMFWMYLNACGENPKVHGVKQELDRIRTYMGRLKEIQDKVNAPKLDQKASKRFVKSALWQAAHKQNADDESRGEDLKRKSPADVKQNSSKKKKHTKR